MFKLHGLKSNIGSGLWFGNIWGNGWGDGVVSLNLDFSSRFYSSSYLIGGYKLTEL